MSDDELTEACAEIMGWKRLGDDLFVDATERGRDPLHDLADAFAVFDAVVAKVQARTAELTYAPWFSRTNPYEAIISVWDEHWSETGGCSIGYALSADRCRALCECAVEAMAKFTKKV